MKQYTIYFFLTCIIGLFVWVPQAQCDFKAGVASTVITPEANLWMSGYASRDKPAEGKIHDLYAKALAIEDEQGNQVVIVTSDLIGVTASMTEDIINRVQEKISLPRNAIMITASHTHCGPVIRDNLETMYELDVEQWGKISEYTASLKGKITDVILEAIDIMEPAHLYRGNGEAGFAVNRRVYTLDGVNFGENPIGPVDNDVPTLKVTDIDGTVRAILFGYACHCTTLSFFHYCGDYAGFAQEYLEMVYPAAAALFFAGCAGDINPSPRRTLENAKQHGLELAGAVKEVLSNPMKEVDGPIKSEFDHVDLQLTEAPNREQIKQQLKHENQYERLLAQDLLKRLDEKGEISETYPLPIQAWRFGDDFLMIAMGGEVVVDYSLLFKHRYGRDDTWVIAYANDVPAYIPSLRILREGGYEAVYSMKYYGMHGPWKEDIQERLEKGVNQLVKKTK